MNPNQKQKKKNINGYVFGVSLTLYQIMICFFYGYWFDYNIPLLGSLSQDGQIATIVFLTTLALVGFGLVNAFMSSTNFSGMGMTLFIFVLTFQQYFLTKAFWEKLGTTSPYGEDYWQNPIVFQKIAFSNVGNDRYFSANDLNAYNHRQYLYYTYSFVDAIACAICNIVAFSALIGRIRMLEVFWLSLISTFLYNLNEQLFRRYEISDTGFGMRIFVYGGFVGFISSLMLGREQTALNTLVDVSSYTNRGFTLFGLLIQFCTFPCLVVGSLYFSSMNNAYVFLTAIMGMYLALVAGFLGTFTASAFIYRRIMIHDVIFSALAGGIVYSSSSDLQPNPAVPLTTGFAMSFITTFYHAYHQKKWNNKRISVSLSYFGRYCLPGLFCGVLSGILQAIHQGTFSFYSQILQRYRSNIGKGALQIAGIGFSIAFALISGIIIGIIFKWINKYQDNNKFVDAKLYRIQKNS